jgi:hypothetical protein
VSTGEKGDELKIDIFYFSGEKLEKVHQICKENFFYDEVGLMLISHRDKLIVEMFKNGFSSNIAIHKEKGLASEYQEKKMISKQLTQDRDRSTVDVLVYQISIA